MKSIIVATLLSLTAAANVRRHGGHSYDQPWCNSTSSNNGTQSSPPYGNGTQTPPPYGNGTNPTNSSEIIILPTLLKTHSINKNLNTPTTNTNTSRTPQYETSTLYEITFPDTVKGMTCAGRFHVSAHNQQHKNEVHGSRIPEFFATGIVDLESQKEGNLRQLSRGRFGFKDTGKDLVPLDETALKVFKGDPCPAGHKVVFESVAVGEYDVFNIGQDSVDDCKTGGSTPEGLRFVAW